MKTRRPRDVFVQRLQELLPHGKARLVAERAGVSPTTLSNWRRGYGNVNPELETMERLAVAMAAVLEKPISVADLVSEREPDDGVALFDRLIDDANRLREKALVLRRKT